MPPASAALSIDRLDSATLLTLEEAVRHIAYLDGRISASFVKQPWMIRAAWSGFAEASRLQGAEIDDIDVFSWGCGVSLPHRARRASHLDEFAGFDAWIHDLADRTPGGWRDRLPFTPQIATDLPVVLRALDLERQYAQQSSAADPWLLLPIALHRLGASQQVLPCLVAGSRSFRGVRRPPPASIQAALRALAGSARKGIAMLDGLERDHRRAARIILGERRAGALRPLAALSLVRPVLSPIVAAEQLDLTISGAGKLLDRASHLGLVREISGRATWKIYLTPDIAILLGFASAARGRPRIDPPLASVDADLAAMLTAFDRDMAMFDARFGSAETNPKGDDADNSE